MTNFAKIRGTFRHGSATERAGILKTFIRSDVPITDATFCPACNGQTLIVLRRAMWQTFTATVDAATFRAIINILPRGVEFRGAFANTPALADYLATI